MLIPWTPDPEPFGNATGFDMVATDVKRAIAEHFGATVAVGRFADDIQAEQEARTPTGEPDEPLASITISHDGLTISGAWPSGNRSVRGYRSSYWLDCMDAETVVFDLRSVADDRIVQFAVRGPMHNPSLPSGMVSTISIPSYMTGVADDYMRHAGTSLEATGARIEP